MKQLNAKHKQDGGTFFGFVVGLVLGLGIAVVVAMIITKTPTPFVDRFAHSNDQQDQQKAAAVNDPNQPLYGNNNTPAPVIKPVPSAPATTTAQQKPSDDPIADLLASKGEMPAPQNTAPVPAPKAAVPQPSAKTNPPVATANSNTDDSWVYYLQTGAFRGWNEAESERARLALLGFEAKVSERTADGSTMYRVRMGPYGQMDAMNKVTSKLSDNGVNYSVIRTKKAHM